MGIFKTLKTEIETVFDRDPAAKSRAEIIFCYPGFHAILFYRTAHWFWTKKFFFSDGSYRTSADFSPA